MVRDVALAAAGLLSPKIGGPSVYPPQPDGVWNVPYSGDEVGDERGRGPLPPQPLHVLSRRSSPYPSLVTFDAPSRELCTVRRVRTNTPLQALTTLNDPVFVEAARALARRGWRREGGHATPPSGSPTAFRLCTARRPEPAELDALVALPRPASGRASRAIRERRGALLAGGAGARLEPTPSGPRWTMVANVLLNLDATLTRE